MLKEKPKSAGWGVWGFVIPWYLAPVNTTFHFQQSNLIPITFDDPDYQTMHNQDDISNTYT